MTERAAAFRAVGMGSIVDRLDREICAAQPHMAEADRELRRRIIGNTLIHLEDASPLFEEAFEEELVKACGVDWKTAAEFSGIVAGLEAPEWPWPPEA